MLFLKRAHIVLIRIFQFPIHIYRFLFSPWVGSQCRFHPTCSAYALEAFEKHGVIGGVFLTTRRLIMCNPWFGKQGRDPVPQGSIWHLRKTEDCKNCENKDVL